MGIVWAIGQWKHYFQGPHPIVIQTDHAPLRHLPNQTSVNSRVWRWLAVLQGYDVDIRHIPGKKNPADSLSRQLVSDALVRKSSVTSALMQIWASYCVIRLWCGAAGFLLSTLWRVRKCHRVGRPLLKSVKL